MAEIHVKGLADIQKLLNTLPAKIERNILRGALRAGAKVIEADARERAPVGPPSQRNVRRYGGYAGALRDSIRVSTKSKGGTVTAIVKAGGRRKGGADVFYAHMVEFGTKAHNISAKTGGWLSIGHLFLKSVKHPGARPQKFMRPALDSQATAAVNAAAQYMRTRLKTKEGLDTSDIILEGDE